MFSRHQRKFSVNVRTVIKGDNLNGPFSIEPSLMRQYYANFLQMELPQL